MIEENKTGISGQLTLCPGVIWECCLGPPLALDTVALAALSALFLWLPDPLSSPSTPSTAWALLYPSSPELSENYAVAVFKNMTLMETQSFSPDADTWSLLLLFWVPVASVGPKLLVTFCPFLLANSLMQIFSQL